MRRNPIPLVLLSAVLLSACEDGTEPDLELGNVDVLPNASVVTAFRTATLERVENDGEISLDQDSPPVLTTEHPLVLEFDTPLDPDYAYIIFLPFAASGRAVGAKRAFIQPAAPTARVVIPASALHDMVEDATDDRVAYRVVIEEIRFREDVFVGTFTDGRSFSLPFAQESETTLHLYLER